MNKTICASSYGSSLSDIYKSSINRIGGQVLGKSKPQESPPGAGLHTLHILLEETDKLRIGLLYLPGLPSGDGRWIKPQTAGKLLL